MEKSYENEKLRKVTAYNFAIQPNLLARIRIVFEILRDFCKSV